MSSENLLRQGISEVIRDCYKVYGTSVVMSRAIPNIIDGLKPVQKRLIYTIYKFKYINDMTKSISICADTLKNFHPHGDLSVYLSLAKLAQDFNTRIGVILTQGN